MLSAAPANDCRLFELVYRIYENIRYSSHKLYDKWHAWMIVMILKHVLFKNLTKP